MAKQIQASVSVKKISEIYQRIKAKTLIPQPEFQRKFVWNRAHKEKFIDTILNGYPFPEIYIAQKGIDVVTIQNQEVVVDGQQRLRTIVLYIDEPKDSKEFGKEVKKYNDLTENEKRDFLNYEVVFRALGDVEPETTIEIFRRINLTQYSLQQVEIENAIYDGEFITTAKEILASIDLSGLPTFSDSEILRMADLYFILLLMSTIENKGYFNRDSQIESYIVNNNDSYEKSNTVKGKLISTIDKITSLQLEPDTIWYRKSNFFTLIIELYKLKSEYLFRWDEIPGNDDGRIIEFLTDEYKIEWVETENICKIDDGKTIIISNKEKSLSFKLNDEKTKVNLKIDDGRVYEFTVETENGKLNIYKSEIDDKKFGQKLIEFENNILANKNADKDENDFSKYYSYMYTGTNSRQARVTRGDLFNKYVMSE